MSAHSARRDFTFLFARIVRIAQMFSVLPPNVLSNGPTIWYWAHYSNNFMNEQNDTVVCAVSRYGISLKFYNSFLLIDLILVIGSGIGYTVVNLSRSNLGSSFQRWFKIVNDFKYLIKTSLKAEALPSLYVLQYAKAAFLKKCRR